jgi:hypothetical protein
MRLNRRYVLFLALSLMAAGFPSGAEGQVDPCSLLPETPADVQKDPTYCMGSYWQRVPTKHFGGLREFGATVAVFPLASPAAAQQKLNTMVKGMTPAAYGDVGFEVLEDASTPDPFVPTPEEIKDNSQYVGGLSDITGETGPKNYAARFVCGAYLIHVFANPSKGPATRQLLADMDAKLKSRNLCSASGAARSVPAVMAPPLAPDPAPVAAPENRGGTRYYDGRIAQEILAAKAAGSRYLVVVDRYEDKQQNCIVEERAWVGGTAASDGGKVGVKVGPTRSVCVRTNVVSVDQVNKSEADLQAARNELTKALQRKEEITAYMKDPKFKTQGTAQLQKVQEWIDYYEKVIAAIQKGLAASVP